jgi:VanZ family protein
LADARVWTGLGDVAGNVALFVPLGALGVLCIGAQRVGASTGFALTLASAAFAFLIQVLQVYLPSRQPSLSDVLWNAVGTALGIGAGFLAEHYVRSLPPIAWPRSRIVLALIAAWVTAELWPFVPALDWFAIKEKLRALVVVASLSSASATYHLVSVAVLGMMLESIESATSATKWLALLVVGVLGAKLVLWAAPLSLSFALGTMLGVVIWALFGDRLGQGASALLLAAFVVTFTLRSLVPFELRAEPVPFKWVPFASVLEGEMSVNLRSLAASVFAFGAMLWLVDRAGGRIAGVTAALALWVLGIEFAQMWIVGRTPDITPPVLVGVTGLLFARLKAWEMRIAAASRVGRLGEAHPESPGRRRR